MESTITKSVNELSKNGYSILDNFVSTIEIAALRNKILELEKGNHLKIAGIGNKNLLQTNTQIRSDKISWINNDDSFIKEIVLDKIELLKQEINRNLFLGINNYEFHFAKYDSGAFYKKHRDAFKTDDARKITIILYLNLNWQPADGGELLLHLENQHILKIEPIGGRLLIFESKLEHEVLLNYAERYSLTGWLKNKKQPF